MVHSVASKPSREATAPCHAHTVGRLVDRCTDLSVDIYCASMGNSSSIVDSTSSHLRDCLLGSEFQYAIFAADSLALPSRQQFLALDPLLYFKSARALVLARDEDVVLLSGPTDETYLSWLRSVGFGTPHVLSFDCPDPKAPLTSHIAREATRVKEFLGSLPGKPLYVPFYCSRDDIRVAETLGVRYFGCLEETTSRYFDKGRFKTLCKDLGLPTVADGAPRKDSNSLSKEELAEVVDALLQTYKALIVRGVDGSGGDSVFRVESGNVAQVLNDLRAHHSPKYLVEPFLRVIASPNDQWCISLDGSLRYIGLSAQLFKGLSHVGNLYGEFFAPRVATTIRQYSQLIGQQMRAEGYRGLFGIDYIVAEDGIFPIENNARMNGSSFAFSIMDRVQEHSRDVRCWKFFKASTEIGSFERLRERLSPLLYSPGRSNAIFPFDCDPLRHTGVFACVLLAEDLYHLEFLEAALTELGIRRV